MVVIGIDFGNDSCVVSVLRNGRIEIVTNEVNVRYTPSMVSFSDRRRDFGASAKNEWSHNAQNTIFDLKSALNVNLTRRWKFNLLNFTENSKEPTFCYKTKILGKKFKLSPCQILAMLLIKIKADAQTYLQTSDKIIGCVIAVPSYFNPHERKSVLLAAAVARLECHFLIKETTAVAINYSLYKTFATPVNVIFIDFGQSAIQISACKFSERELEVIDEVYELIGGRDIDEKLAEYFIDTYKIHGIDRRNKMFIVQLLHEVEELKKKMSVNVGRLPLDFKPLNFFHHKPISMERSEMEKICAPLFEKIENLMRLCLERSMLKVEDIHSIEMVGGSSRMPIIVSLAEKVFGKIPLATMNRDDAVAKGCLLKSAMNIKKKSYKIKEKAFNDDDSFNTGWGGMEDHVRVFQVHRYLKWDYRDAFNVTESEFMEYIEIEKELARYDLDEKERQTARNNLEKYLAEQMKPEGLLGNANAAMRKELNKTRMWDNGTKDQYLDLLDYWTQKVAKIKRRNLIEKFDGKHMSGCDCVRTNRKTHRSNADQTIIKRLTFKECSKVSAIRGNQSDSTGSVWQSSKPRYRKGFRRHRINHNCNEGQDAELVKSQSQFDGSQNLLFNCQKKKRPNWCCFL